MLITTLSHVKVNIVKRDYSLISEQLHRKQSIYIVHHPWNYDRSHRDDGTTQQAELWRTLVKAVKEDGHHEEMEVTGNVPGHNYALKVKNKLTQDEKSKRIKNIDK